MTRTKDGKPARTPRSTASWLPFTSEPVENITPGRFGRRSSRNLSSKLLANGRGRTNVTILILGFCLSLLIGRNHSSLVRRMEQAMIAAPKTMSNAAGSTAETSRSLAELIAPLRTAATQTHDKQPLNSSLPSHSTANLVAEQLKSPNSSKYPPNAADQQSAPDSGVVEKGTILNATTGSYDQSDHPNGRDTAVTSRGERTSLSSESAGADSFIDSPGAQKQADAFESSNRLDSPSVEHRDDLSLKRDTESLSDSRQHAGRPEPPLGQISAEQKIGQSESSNAVADIHSDPTLDARGPQSEGTVLNSDDHRKTFVEPSTISNDYAKVIEDFFESVPRAGFSRSAIDKYKQDPDVAALSVYIVFEGGNATLSFNNVELRGTAGGAQPRLRSLQIMMKILETEYMVPDCSFLVQLNDGFKPKVVMFGSARHWHTWQFLIPVPMGNDRGLRTGTGTSFFGWDDYMESQFLRSHSLYPWNLKWNKAVFRGNFAMQTHALGTCNRRSCTRAKHWSEVNRGVLLNVAKSAPYLMDVQFVSSSQGVDVPVIPGARLTMRDHQKYKYILNVGSNQDWAERLRILLLLNSAVIRHEAETVEFFYPLLKPYKHYIPTNLMMDDLIKGVEWAVENDEKVQEIVRNANEFARTYLALDRMKEYWFMCLTKYAQIQKSLEN